MSKDCLYVAVLLVMFINNVKTEASNDPDPSGSLDHENMEFDGSVIESESNIESSFNEGIHLAENCNCKKGYICESINGKPTCKCPPEYGEKINIILGNECVPCKCGKESNCTITNPQFSSMKIKCICKEGYQDVKNFCRGPCTDNPCQNGGTCADENKTFKCVCPPGYTGNKCETKSDPCSSNPCKNNGKCIIDDKSFKCACNKPYYGIQCEKDVCTENPCINEGVCEIEGDSFKCTCNLPYIGNTCEEDVCTKNPCKNEGVCAIEGDAFKCTCNLPYIGNTCEEDVCTENPCKNEGVCVIEGDSFKCTCNLPYIGNTCEEDVCTVNPCKHEGECVIEGDSFKCYCKKPYLGDTCESECYCGENSVSCRTDGRGNKLCFCKEDYGQRRGTDTCSRTCQSNADCRNDGICDRDGPGYFCLCPEPFIGDRCELDVCNSVRFECRSKGAECVRQGTIGVCKCPRGKKMSLFNYCEDVCTYETCVHGTCELTDYNFSQYVCNCYEGYYGRHCENALIMQYTPAITIIVILASGIVLFSITSIVAGCWVKRLRKKIAENTKQIRQP